MSEYRASVIDDEIARQAKLHAALGEPVRLAIVDELSRSDRSPKELGERFGLRGNLLAHHLDVLEGAGFVERFTSSGDRRRRYVRLRPDPIHPVGVAGRRLSGRALFVCTHNSARSQLAAALWQRATGVDATSAGTHPEDSVHPGAVAAAARAGLDLTGTAPRVLDGSDDCDLVVTVCDRAHEELADGDHLHWSVPDPVPVGTASAFDAALADLDRRITSLARGDRQETP